MGAEEGKKKIDEKGYPGGSTSLLPFSVFSFI
jgi:hypothetical protein